MKQGTNKATTTTHISLKISHKQIDTNLPTTGEEKGEGTRPL